LSNEKIKLPVSRSDSRHVYHLYVVFSDERDTLKKSMEDKGVVTGIHYPMPVHKHQGYIDKCILPKKGLPITETTVDGILSLPMYPELSSSQLEAIVYSLGS